MSDTELTEITSDVVVAKLIPGMRLTRQGKAVMARGIIGENIHFTKVSIGDGEFDYDTESVYELEEMRHWCMDLPIVKMAVVGDGTVYIKAYLSNAEVYKGFAAREHALIAVDQTTGKEIIYSYRNCGNEYDFIPANTGPAHKNIYVEYISEIQDAENVTATLDLSVAYLGVDEFDAHVEAAHPHPNTPNHYLDVTETNKIWATDEDNHLHQISVANLKHLLRDDTSTTPILGASNEEIIFRAREELGLNANMLLVEDFTNPDTIDNFKKRVTSSAENGLLLGVENVEGLRTGAYYTISDGDKSEVVKIASLIYNISNYHARLENRLDHSYDWNATYLYRTTEGGSERKFIEWAPDDEFRGVEANIAREIKLNMAQDKRNDFEISGDGFLTSDGYFTLG